MKNSNRKTKLSQIIGGVLLIVFSVFGAPAQSTSQSYPTAVTSGEISGRITARDLGDSRLTSYYYFFNGTQGDVFVNIKTSNLDGDIDVFAAENLRPLTKITVFSDVPSSETGRVIYLRKPEKLILRIQGRSPNEQPAVFNLKFAGSFVPAQATAAEDSSELPEIKGANQTGARVNSVGTIIEAEPKPVETVASEPKKNKSAKTNAPVEISETSAPDAPVESPSKQPKKSRAKKTKNVKPAVVEQETADESEQSETPARKTPPPKTKTKARAERADSEPGRNAEKAAAPNPLENVRLLIELKDGTRVERPMSEVLRVGVDKGVLTLITRSGAISRYSILDVAKMTIE